nr:hypothetical protein CFP56_00396 [Quercus suber]
MWLDRMQQMTNKSPACERNPSLLADKSDIITLRCLSMTRILCSRSLLDDVLLHRGPTAAPCGADGFMSLLHDDSRSRQHQHGPLGSDPSLDVPDTVTAHAFQATQSSPAGIRRPEMHRHQSESCHRRVTDDAATCGNACRVSAGIALECYCFGGLQPSKQRSSSQNPNHKQPRLRQIEGPGRAWRILHMVYAKVGRSLPQGAPFDAANVVCVRRAEGVVSDHGCAY